MFGELKDVVTTNRVADLPTTINFNNTVVRDEFDYLFDSSNNYFRQSLYAPRGYVKAHWGDFVNLRVTNLTVDNLVTKTQSTDNGQNENILKSHNDSIHRFSWQIPPEKRPEKDVLNFAHDTKMIVSFADEENPIAFGDKEYHYPISLREELDALENTVDSLAKNITIKLHDDEIYRENSEEYGEGSDDIETQEMLFSVSDPDQNFQSEVRSRLENIEKRLTQIEYRLDTKN